MFVDYKNSLIALSEECKLIAAQNIRISGRKVSERSKKCWLGLDAMLPPIYKRSARASGDRSERRLIVE